MNPDDYGRLPRHPETGTAVIKIMTDPSGDDAAGVDRAFLSLVDRGANGRTFTVVKAAGSPDDSSPALQPGTDEALEGQPPLWRRMFAFLLGGGNTPTGTGAVGKSDNAPVDFDAAVAMPKLREQLWTLEDGLREVIRNVLAADDVTDKPAAIAVALDRFKAHVLLAVNQALLAPTTVVSKSLAAYMATPAAAEWGTAPSIPADRSAIVAIDATVQTVQKALADLPPLLARLTAGKAGSPAPHTLEDDNTMITAAMLTLIATTAGEQATLAAKAAGITDPAVLEQRRAHAAAVAMKVAITGAPQPGIPTDTLAQQMAMAPFGNSPADFEAKIASAVQSALGGMVAKLADLEAKLVGKGEGDAREPGVLEVVVAQGKAIDAMASTVAKIAGKPAAPRAAAEPQLGADGKPVVAAKGADDDGLFDGTPLAFNHRAPGNAARG